MKLTILLILIAIAVFFISFSLDTESVFNTYGFSGKNMLANPVVLITSIFLHASLIHLLSNILIWFFFGSAVEKELGAAKTLAIFFLGAFAGSFLSLLFYPFDTIGIGASAGIFALVGTGMLVKPMDLSFYPLIVPVPLIFLGILYAVYNVYAFFMGIDQSVSYVAHFGGLIVGLVFGFRTTGVKHGLKIILLAIGVMALIPILWKLLFG